MRPLLLCCAALLPPATATRVTVSAVLESPTPILSAQNAAGKGRCTAASFCYNAAFVPKHGDQPAGILARLRNLSAGYLGPSRLGWAPTDAKGRAGDMTPRDIVFGPAPGLAVENNGTEDPRVALDPSTGIYHLAYTAFDAKQKGDGVASSAAAAPYVALHLATSRTPNVVGSWVRSGPAFPWLNGHIQSNHTKSGAMLIRPKPPHYIIFLHTQVSSAFVATSSDLVHWRPLGSEPLLAPRPGLFDSHLTEPGPPPMQLSDGTWIFFCARAKACPKSPPALLTAFNAGMY